MSGRPSRPMTGKRSPANATPAWGAGALFENGLLSLLRSKHTDLLNKIRDTRDLDDAAADQLKGVVDGYAKSFA